MSLNLAPKVETALRQHAERAGVSVDELLERVFPLTPPDIEAGSRFAGENGALCGMQTRYAKKSRGGTSELCAEWDAEDR